MACRPLGDKALPETMVAYYQLHHKERISIKLRLKNQDFSLKNAFANVVCRVATILSGPSIGNPASHLVSLVAPG